LVLLLPFPALPLTVLVVGVVVVLVIGLEPVVVIAVVVVAAGGATTEGGGLERMPWSLLSFSLWGLVVQLLSDRDDNGDDDADDKGSLQSTLVPTG
jgi:hypothetical protein